MQWRNIEIDGLVYSLGILSWKGKHFPLIHGAKPWYGTACKSKEEAEEALHEHVDSLSIKEKVSP